MLAADGWRFVYNEWIIVSEQRRKKELWPKMVIQQGMGMVALPGNGGRAEDNDGTA